MSEDQLDLVVGEEAARAGVSAVSKAHKVLGHVYELVLVFAGRVSEIQEAAGVERLYW